MRPTTGLKDMFFELDPGTAKAGEFQEGDTIPVANTAPDVNLDEILVGARLRHAGLPEAAPGRRRQGPRRAATRTSASCSARLGPDQQGPRQAQLRGRPAQGEPRPADPQLQPADDHGRPVRPRPDRAGRVLQRRARRDRRAGPERAAGGQPAAEHAQPGDHDAQPHVGARLGPGSGVRRPAPVRAQPRRAEQLDPLARRVDHPGARRTRSARSCAPRAGRCPTCARPRAATRPRPRR